MSPTIIFISTGLLVYWMSRLRVLRHGSEDEINQALDRDLLSCRRILLRFRSMFMLPTMAG